MIVRLPHTNPQRKQGGSVTPPTPKPKRRWLGLAALLVVELLLLGLAFDAGEVGDRTSLSARFMLRVPRAALVVLAVVAATLLVGGRALWADFCEFRAQRRVEHHWKRWLAAHWGALGLLAWITTWLLAGEEGPGEYAAIGAAAWAVLAVAGALAWSFALAPAGDWLALVRRRPRVLAAGVVLGVTASLAGWVSARVGWKFTSEAALWTMHKMLALIYDETVYDPLAKTLGTSSFSVGIDTACSGYQGVGLIVVFLGGYLWLSRRSLRFPHALALVPLGAAMIWLANAARVVLLIVIGTSGWPDVALGGFHSQAGWLAFNAVALGLVAITPRIGFFSRQAVARDRRSQADPTTAFLAPFLGIVATSMVTGALSSGFDWGYPLRVVVAAALLLYFRPVYAQVSWSFSWQAFAAGALAFSIWWSLVPVDPTLQGGLPLELQRLPALGFWPWMAIRTLGYIVTAPLAEELAFRGYLPRRWLSADFETVPMGRFTWTGFFVSSALFGAMHGSSWLPATLAGMVFAAALYRRGNLADAVMAHATTNLLVALYVFATGDWYLWG